MSPREALARIKSASVLAGQDPGPCLFCDQYVESGRVLAGAPDSTSFQDPCWHVDGDFGCEASPLTDEEGTGDHIRPSDVRRLLLASEGKSARELELEARCEALGKALRDAYDAGTVLATGRCSSKLVCEMIDTLNAARRVLAEGGAA